MDKKKVTSWQSLEIKWRELYIWALAAHTRGAGLIPSDCQVFWNHFPSSHHQMWLELSVITTTESPSTYPAVLTDDVELDASGVGDEPALLCLTSEAASVKIIILCHDVWSMGKKGWSLSCLWLDQHKSSHVDNSQCMSVFLHPCGPLRLKP